MSGGAQHNHQIDGRGREGVRFEEPAARLGAGSVEACGSRKGLPHAATIEIDPEGQGRQIARAYCLRVAARGRKMNGPRRAPSVRTSFAVATSPRATATADRVRPHLSRSATHFLPSDPPRHGSIGIGASAGLFDHPLLCRRADQTADHSRPTTHYRRPLAQAPRLDVGNMRQAVVAVDFQRTPEKEQVRA